MSYPLGVVTRTINVGDSLTVESGTDLTVRATLRSSRGLVWVATGERAVSVPEVRESAAAGDAVTFTPPVTDQAGWRDLATGSLIDVSAPGSHTHTYTIELVTLRGERPVDRRIIGPFPLPTGDGSPVDADLLIAADTVPGLLVSVPDAWSAQVAAIPVDIVTSTAIARIITSTDPDEPISEGDLLIVYDPYVKAATDFTDVTLSEFTQQWNVGAWSIESGELRFAGGTARRALSWDVVDADPDRADVEILARIRAATSSSVGRGVILRGGGRAGSETGFFCSQLNGAVVIGQYISGTYRLRNGIGFSPANGSLFWVRFRAEGNSVMARCWQDGAAEPDAWGLVVAAGAIPGPGFVVAHAAGGATAQMWDRMAVAVGGATAVMA